MYRKIKHWIARLRQPDKQELIEARKACLLAQGFNELESALLKIQIIDLQYEELEHGIERMTKLEHDMHQLVDYHREHIEPCRKALESTAKAIYNWAEALSNTNIDCSSLFDYIVKTTKTIDAYNEED